MRHSSSIDAIPHGRPDRGPRVVPLLIIAFCLALGLLPARRTAAAGPLDRLDCAPGYTAAVYARGLRAPDGLAFSPDGALYVVEEMARSVSRIDGEGQATRVMRDLNSPEGIAFDEAGNLYVIEDARNGRLIRMAPDGQWTILAENLDAPEGIVVLSMTDEDGHPAPIIYITESNLQFERTPTDFRSGISALSEDGERTPVLSHAPRLRGLDVAFWSYAGLTAGPDGRLYVTNELSGKQLTRRVTFVSDVLTYTFKVLTGHSVFAVDPVDGTRTLIAEDLLVPEGLSFSSDSDFPLYVAEENVGSQGRLSRIERDGRRTTVCERFLGIEDVVVDARGDLYVSEDGSGSVIRISVPETVDASASKPLARHTVDLIPNSDRWWHILNRFVKHAQRVVDHLVDRFA